MVVLQLYVQFRFNYWNRELFDALESRDPARLKCVRIATDAPIDFALGLVASLLTAIIFIQVLWNVGGDFSFALLGYRVWISGYLVVSVAIYSGIVTTAMVLVGSPLTRMIQVKHQAEAELITAAHRLRDIGEGAQSGVAYGRRYRTR